MFIAFNNLNGSRLMSKEKGGEGERIEGKQTKTVDPKVYE
jgi:hypothetical protein